MIVLRLKRVARFATFAVVAALMTLTSGITATPAEAGFERFWEQGAAAARKPAYKQKASYSRKSASKRSAYGKKSSAKSRYGKKKHYAKRKKLGGYAAATEKRKGKSGGVRVAALGDTYYPQPKAAKSLTGSKVTWTASSSCLDSGLRAIVYQVAANYGPLRVNSTCRSRGHNRAVGGAPRSKHLSGDAVDFRVSGNVRAVYAYLKSNGGVGGLKHYGGGLFHIDTGPRRSW